MQERFIFVHFIWGHFYAVYVCWQEKNIFVLNSNSNHNQQSMVFPQSSLWRWENENDPSKQCFWTRYYEKFAYQFIIREMAIHSKDHSLQRTKSCQEPGRLGTRRKVNKLVTLPCSAELVRVPLVWRWHVTLLHCQWWSIGVCTGGWHECKWM